MTTTTAIGTAELLQAGIAAHQAGRLAEAEGAYRRVLDSEPKNAEALHMLGVIALQADNPALAVQLIDAANDSRPRDAVILANLAEAFRRLDCLEDARRCAEEAVALQPRFASAHVNLGITLKMLERYDDAEASYRRAIDLDPTAASARLNLALLCLLRGTYDEGLELFESRLEDGNLKPGVDTRRLLNSFSRHAIPRWQGERIHGRNLLIWTEQGLGDTLMTMRYLPRLKELGVARLSVCCETQLVRVICAMPDVDEVFSDTSVIGKEPRFDVQCPMMSLPLRMATRIDTIPCDVPYLRVSPELDKQWSARVAGLRGLRVGLVWAGGPKTSSDPLRSVALAAFAPLMALRGCTFVSLQKGEAAAQLQAHPRVRGELIDLCGDLMDTAALVSNLDVVITVDTSVAHLAGALGKPVWLLNRMGSEWRWLLERGDSPWYPTMRIFRQQGRDWNAVMRSVAAELKAAIRARSAAQGWLGHLRQLLMPR